MRLIALPAILAFVAASTCLPAFAQTPDQAHTAHHDTEFLKQANQGSVDEVNLGQIAAQKATDPDLQAFAQKMVHDHSQLLDDMKPFDAEAGLTVPEHSSVAALATEAKLKLLSGKSFDTAYIKDMVEDHHKDLAAFISEEKSTGYPAFKDAVAKGESVIRSHMEMINGIAKKHGIAPAPLPKAK